MNPNEIAAVQSMVGFTQWLEHESLVRTQGNWETDEAIYVVEEYTVHGDIMQVWTG